MHETPDDVKRIQELLDRSHASMGAHMRGILTAERRFTAPELIDELHGMKVLALATVTAGGEPRVGPVDGVFYRGEFWFGSSPNAVRFRHIRACPAVSATHLDGERLAVTVHGHAVLVDVTAPGLAGFRGVLIDIYGEAWWRDVGESAQFARIDPRRMYTYVSG